jgi:hypothetical protein
MYLITPNFTNVRDALTGDIIPVKGVERAILLPTDHLLQRTGEVSIVEIKPENAENAQNNESKPKKEGK